MSSFKMDSITDIFNEHSMKEKSSWRVKMIDIDEIEPNEKNEYSISEIEEMRLSISLLGVRTNLEVMKTSQGTYKLLSGERRYTAVKQLVEEDGREDLRMVPCRVADPEKEIEADIPTEIKELWLLTATNTQRNKTDGDRMVDFRNHQKIYEALVASGVALSGRQREQIAVAMKISPMQVQRLSTIEKKLSAPLKAGFENDDIPLTVAYAAAVSDKETQKELEKKFAEKGTITQVDVDIANQKVKEDNQTVCVLKAEELTFTPVALEKDLELSGADYKKVQSAKEKIQKQLALINKIIQTAGE